MAINFKAEFTGAPKEPLTGPKIVQNKDILNRPLGTLNPHNVQKAQSNELPKNLREMAAGRKPKIIGGRTSRFVSEDQPVVIGKDEQKAA
jgi:hypothetical protein